VDTQGEDPSEDDLQSAAVELPEVPVPLLHGPGAGAASARLARLGHVQHAGGGQQRQGQRTVPGVRTRLPVEVVEPRGARPLDGAEAGPFVVQVHRVHGHLRHVQAVREPRVLGAQRGRETRHGPEKGACDTAVVVVVVAGKFVGMNAHLIYIIFLK